MLRNTNRFLPADSIRQLTSGAVDGESTATVPAPARTRSVSRLARSAASAERRADCAAERSHRSDRHDNPADHTDTASANTATPANQPGSDHTTSAYGPDNNEEVDL